MPITENDIKLLKSARMSDTPDGGGRMSADVVQSGVDNNIFDDVSNLDRVYGNVSLRKVFGAVLTNDRDKYLGARVIIDKAPADENVHGLIFDASSLFDTRTQTSVKVESYLAPGGFYQGLLYGNHLAGMSTVMLIQQEDRELPTVGQVLLLRKNEDLPNEFDQYVKITAVTGAVQTFTDASGNFTRRVVTCSISDALREAFPGFQASRIDADLNFTGKTRVFDTVVADASQYYGIRPLETAASIGAFTIKADSAYSPLLPSAQVETPIADARSNGVSNALASTGGPVTQTFTLNFNTTQQLFIGGGVLPGSLTIVGGSVTLTDDGGVLKNGGADVGTVDYENGIASLSTNVFGTSTFTVTYTPAAVAQFINQSRGIAIGLPNRALSYVLTLGTPPAPGSLSVSYMVAGRWYVLRDNGTGGVLGATSALGAGTINYTTGTLAVTLGALPDVGGALVVQWAEDALAVPQSNTEVLNGGKVYFPINSAGALSEAPATPFAPNTITITWTHDGSTKTATDDGNGNLTGDATGKVNYANGVAFLSPTQLPAVGTVFSLAQSHRPSLPAPIPITTSGGNLGANVAPLSVRFEIDVLFSYTHSEPGVSSKVLPPQATVRLPVQDNGAGQLVMNVTPFTGGGLYGTFVTVGTINYTTGDVVLSATPTVPVDEPNLPVIVTGWR